MNVGATSPNNCLACGAGTYDTVTGASASILRNPCNPGTVSITDGASNSKICAKCRHTLVSILLLHAIHVQGESTYHF